MSQTDPIADMLTIIRNGSRAAKESVDFTHSSVKADMLKILQEEGFIKAFRVLNEDSAKKVLRVYLAYDQDGGPIINGLKRISKPGLRRYTESKKVPKVKGGRGVAVMSTSSGVITDKVAREKNVGGEVLCFVW